jgi:hypothetical protein
MLTQHPDRSLITFVRRDRWNFRLLLVALCCIVGEWVVFKLAYPFPDFFSDSYSYINAAANNLDINIWPIGYSKFLRLFHYITYSDTAFVSFQFFSLELAALYFYFTVLYWFKPGQLVTVGLFLFLFCNPLFFYLSNYVSTEALFAALSLVWFTELLWIIFRPGHGKIWLQTACVFIAFTFRYNALYYPIVTAMAYLLSRQKVLAKWVGTLAVLPLLVAFWLFSRDANLRLSGVPEASILSGWQMANNALYMRGKIKVQPGEFSTPACRELDSISAYFFSRVGPNFDDFLNNNPGNFFIQDWRAPLKIYMVRHYNSPGRRPWATVSPVFGEYGTTLIKAYPLSYARYFLLPNTANYFDPNIEKLVVYNMGMDSVMQPAPEWFHYSTPRIRVISKTLQGDFLFVFSFFFMAINFFLICGAFWYFYNKVYRGIGTVVNRACLLMAIFLIFNFGFSVLAGIIVLRYQFFPMILITLGNLVLFEWVGTQKPSPNNASHVRIAQAVTPK